MNSNLENKGVEKLKEAFNEINQWEYENLHLDTLEEVIPSTRYKKRMDRLIRRQKQPCWKYVNTVGKRVAVFVLAITLTFALSMSVAAVREPVVEFFVNVYEKFVEFFYDEDDIAKAPDTIETVYTLGYVPEGYALVERTIFDTSVRTIWKNDSGEIIIFSQLLLKHFHSMDFEDLSCKNIAISDVNVVCFEKNKNYSLYWNSNEYAYSIIFIESLTIEEYIKLVESIEIFSE